MKYLFFDGDNVGISIERFLMRGEIKSAQDLSNGINTALERIRNFLTDVSNVDILLLGGDDILIVVKDSAQETYLVEKITQIFYDSSGLTISCGIGDTIQESIFNLHLAKLFGKNQTRR